MGLIERKREWERSYYLSDVALVDRSDRCLSNRALGFADQPLIVAVSRQRRRRKRDRVSNDLCWTVYISIIEAPFQFHFLEANFEVMNKTDSYQSLKINACNFHFLLQNYAENLNISCIFFIFCYWIMRFLYKNDTSTFFYRFVV